MAFWSSKVALERRFGMTSGAPLKGWGMARRQSGRGLGRCLPVFDAGYAVLAPRGVALPRPSRSERWHSASVDLLVAGLNGLGGSLCTMRSHPLAGACQFTGNLLATLGGLTYVPSHLLGMNLDFLGQRCQLPALSLVGQALWLFWGGIATLLQALTAPLRCWGEHLAAREVRKTPRRRPNGPILRSSHPEGALI